MGLYWVDFSALEIISPYSRLELWYDECPQADRMTAVASAIEESPHSMEQGAG